MAFTFPYYNYDKMSYPLSESRVKTLQRIRSMVPNLLVCTYL